MGELDFSEKMIDPAGIYLAEQEKGYPSLLFVNAQNKQTIRDIIAPLRGFGVPAVAISDCDILKDGGDT